MYTHTILKNMLRAETVDIEDVSVAPEVILWQGPCAFLPVSSAVFVQEKSSWPFRVTPLQ